MNKCYGVSGELMDARQSLCEDVYKGAQPMTETLSIRIDAETKERLDALSKRSNRSKSFLAAEAIGAYIESEEWQLGEIQAGLAELDAGQVVSHDKVSKWLNSWGKPDEKKAPR
jgi:RHH-type rel operon transcriptional repressor/antitoxin RelB